MADQLSDNDILPLVGIYNPRFCFMMICNPRNTIRSNPTLENKKAPDVHLKAFYLSVVLRLQNSHFFLVDLYCAVGLEA